MAARLLAEELEVLEVIRATEAGEMTDVKVVEHFRNKRTSTRVLNILDSLWQKKYLLKGWPGLYVLKDPTDKGS